MLYASLAQIIAAMMWTLAVAGLLLRGAAAQQSGNHPEWPRWCGKVYMPE
jgi:hypothetical protein